MADEKLRVIMQDMLQNPHSHPGFQMQKGRLKYEGKLVLPRRSLKITLVMQELHDSVSGGHSGFFKTYKEFQPYCIGKE